MSILINRFEAKILENGAIFKTDNKKSVKIIDHTNDKVICIVNFGINSKANIDIANKIIETIEEFIESDSDGTQDQH